MQGFDQERKSSLPPVPERRMSFVRAAQAAAAAAKDPEIAQQEKYNNCIETVARLILFRSLNTSNPEKIELPFNKALKEMIDTELKEKFTPYSFVSLEYLAMHCIWVELDKSIKYKSGDQVVDEDDEASTKFEKLRKEIISNTMIEFNRGLLAVDKGDLGKVRRRSLKDIMPGPKL